MPFGFAETSGAGTCAGRDDTKLAAIVAVSFNIEAPPKPSQLSSSDSIAWINCNAVCRSNKLKPDRVTLVVEYEGTELLMNQYDLAAS